MIKSLASSSDSILAGGFIVFRSGRLFRRQVGCPGGLASRMLSRPLGYPKRFFFSSFSLRSVSLELFIAAFRLALSKSSNFACKFLFYCVDFELLNPIFLGGFAFFLGPLVT